MISTNDLQRCYVKIYKCLMHYIFDFDTVEALADFEIAVYRVFPDMDEISNKLTRLKSQLRYIGLTDDEDLNKAFDKFEELIEDTDIYYGVKTYREVIENEDHENE